MRHKSLVKTFIFSFLIILLQTITGLAQIKAPTFCFNPSPSQERTLHALASAVGESYSSQNCNTLYQKLGSLYELNLEKKRIEDLTPIRELNLLEKLILDNNRIHDLTPLSGLTKLKKLFLVNNRILDISPLVTLGKLETLYLSFNRIEDISVLRKLSSLKYLYLSYNNVSNLSPLRHSYKLTWLIIDHNKVSTISVLHRLKYIKKIDLLGNPIKKAGSIAHFPNFKKFRLPKGTSLALPKPTFIQKKTVPITPVPDNSKKLKSKIKQSAAKPKSSSQDIISKIETPFVKNVETEHLYGKEKGEKPKENKDLVVAKIIPIEPEELPTQVPGYYVGRTYPLLCKSPTISQKKTLEILALKVDTFYSPDNCIDLYKRLNKLIMLIVQGRRLEDISPLESLTNLTWLFLYNNNIKNIYPLQNMTKLRSLGLNHNRIEDITPLKGLKNLSTLSLHNNRIKDISPLKDLVKLKSLSLHNNEIRDISPLQKLSGLASLKLNYNEIKDLTPLQSLVSLNELHLKQNRIVSVTPLKDLASLIKLDLSLNEITDFAPIQNMANYPHFILSKKRKK